jgi:hypothetical protein
VLRAAEAASVEVHLAACERCQAMLATLAATEPAVGVPATVPLWRRWHLQWLVPLATAAIAVAVWVAVPGELTAPPQVADRVAPAQKSESSAPVRPEPPASPDSGRRQAFEQELTARAPAPADALKKSAPLANSASAFAKEKDAGAVAEAKPAAPLPADRFERRADADRRAKAEESRRVIAVPQTAPEPAAAAAAPPPVTASPVPAPSPPPPAAPAASPASIAPAPATAAGSAARERVAGLAESVQTKVTALEFASPAGESRWRLASGRVEFSSTAGEWRLTDVPANMPLLAGSSPSPRVCWLVGRLGIVYLTIDGLHFTRIPSPDPADLLSLLSVRATDEKTATVTAATGRTYSTTDAGKTWR